MQITQGFAQLDVNEVVICVWIEELQEGMAPRAKQKAKEDRRNGSTKCRVPAIRLD